MLSHFIRHLAYVEYLLSCEWRKMLKHVQISPHRNRSDSVSLRSSISSSSSLCGSPEPHDSLRPSSRASSYCSLNETMPQVIKNTNICFRFSTSDTCAIISFVSKMHTHTLTQANSHKSNIKWLPICKRISTNINIHVSGERGLFSRPHVNFPNQKLWLKLLRSSKTIREHKFDMLLQQHFCKWTNTNNKHTSTHLHTNKHTCVCTILLLRLLFFVQL